MNRGTIVIIDILNLRGIDHTKRESLGLQNYPLTITLYIPDTITGKRFSQILLEACDAVHNGWEVCLGL